MADFERFGLYRVYECLGAGGMATVHRATIELESGEHREVALKRLLPQFADDKRFVEDFVREAKLVAHLQHPNIVRVLELGRSNKSYFIAMELVRGHVLVDLLRKSQRKQRLPPIGAVLSIGREICDALAHAHERVVTDGERMPIVHRDLTPSNVLVTDDGHVKVIDFGVAKALAGAHQTSSGLVKGKLGYMAIEAISGKRVDTRADIFSVGVVLWELITGRRLFRAPTEHEVIVKIRNGDVSRPSQFNPDCPTELDELVLRALERESAHRWPSAAAMRRALDDVRRDYGEAATAAGVAQWTRQLRIESTLQLRVESDAESTAMLLSDDDLIEDAPEHLAEASQRAEPTNNYDGMQMPRAPSPAPVRVKFVVADTIVTGKRDDD